MSAEPATVMGAGEPRALRCGRCGAEASGRFVVVAGDDSRGGEWQVAGIGVDGALGCTRCGGCEWFHIEGERPVFDGEAGGPYR